MIFLLFLLKKLPYIAPQYNQHRAYIVKDDFARCWLMLGEYKQNIV